MVMSHLIRGNFCRDGDGDKNVKRAISLDWQNNRQQLYTCIALFVNFFAVTLGLRRKIAEFLVLSTM